MPRMQLRLRRRLGCRILSCCWALLAGLLPAEAATGQCLGCEQLSALRTALTVVNLPEKWLSDERLTAAGELFQPFNGTMEPAAFVALLRYLKADPRDFTLEQAQFALDFIQRKSLGFGRRPPQGADRDALWQAVGLNSAARGDDLVLLQRRFAEAGFPAEQIPADVFFAVADRAAADAAASARAMQALVEGKGGTEARAEAAENAAESAENAKNAAALAKNTKVLADQEAAASEFGDLAALLLAATPAKSRRPWDQLESNTKALMSGATANLSLLTGVLALKGNKGIKGGVAGLLVQTADALTLQEAGPAGEPVASPVLGSLSEVLNHINGSQSAKADAEQEKRLIEQAKAIPRIRAGLNGVQSQAIGLKFDGAAASLDLATLARQAGIVVPQVRVPLAGVRAPECGPAELRQLNDYLLGWTGLPEWGSATASYFDTRTSPEDVICAFTDGSYLIDDGQLQVVAGLGAVQIGLPRLGTGTTGFGDAAVALEDFSVPQAPGEGYAPALARYLVDALRGYRR